MKHLKKFNENNQDTKCHDFYQRYKNIVNFNEDDYDEGDEPSKVDLLDEIGDLCNELNMSKEDVEYVLKNYNCSFDFYNLLKITLDNWVEDEDEYPDEFPTKPGFVERRMRQQKEYESKYTISLAVPVSAYELLKNNGVPDKNIVAAYTEYVKHSLGITYGTDLDEFRAWCDESDNLVEFQD